jgi:hypothetical protein
LESPKLWDFIMLLWIKCTLTVHCIMMRSLHTVHVTWTRACFNSRTVGRTVMGFAVQLLVQFGGHCRLLSSSCEIWNSHGVRCRCWFCGF